MAAFHTVQFSLQRNDCLTISLLKFYEDNYIESIEDSSKYRWWNPPVRDSNELSKRALRRPIRRIVLVGVGSQRRGSHALDPNPSRVMNSQVEIEPPDNLAPLRSLNPVFV